VTQSPRPWFLELPSRRFIERNVSVSNFRAKRWVETIRGEPAELPEATSRYEIGRYGEDLVGGWLLENGGLIEGLERAKRVRIPEGGASTKRTADWMVGRRIIVEVKTWGHVLNQGEHAKNTRQIDDYCRWRDEKPHERATVLARVTWKGNSETNILFRGDLMHFGVPLLNFNLTV
jgi:hypothetical protein